MGCRLHRLFGVPGILLVGMVAVQAGAEAPPRGDPALAEALFHEAASLMDRADYATACPKLEESQALDPAPGTLLRLALCHEAIGRTATAWAEFRQGLEWARRDRRQDRIDFAERHLRTLTPELSTLALIVPEQVARLPGLVVRRDTLVIGPAVFGLAAPVDPGLHRITAEAPQHESIRVEVQVEERADRKTVVIPALRPLPSPEAPRGVPKQPLRPQPASPVPATRQVEGTQPAAWRASWNSRSTGYVMGTAGLLVTGLGLYFGLRAIDSVDEANQLCPQSPCSSKEGVEASRHADRFAWAADVGVGLGLIGMGVGTYLVLSYPRDPGAPSTGSSAGVASIPGGALVLMRSGF